MNFWEGFFKKAHFMNAELQPYQDIVQDDEYLGTPEEGYFFHGFKKKAAMPGQRSGVSAAVGPRATSMVTTAPAFKPQPVPSPIAANAKHNLAATVKSVKLKNPVTTAAHSVRGIPKIPV